MKAEFKLRDQFKKLTPDVLLLELLKYLFVVCVSYIGLLLLRQIPSIREFFSDTLTVSNFVLVTIVFASLAFGSISSYVFHNIKLSRIRKLLLIDDITGLPNNKTVKTTLQKEIDKARKDASSKLAVVLIDIVDFKSINDKSNRHFRAGNSVLREFAYIVKSDLRITDHVIRYMRGDEFLIITNGPWQAGRVISRRLNEEVLPKFPVRVGGRDIKLSIWAGVTEYNPSEDNVEILLERVEGCLFKAKRPDYPDVIYVHEDSHPASVNTAS